MLLPEGTYTAKATAPATIWYSDGGALMVSIPYEIVDPPDYAGNIHQDSRCLVSKTDVISEITVKELRNAFGWTTDDPFWLTEPGNIEQAMVDLVMVHEEYNGQVKARAKYLNRPGESGGAKTPADRKAVMAKFGARFRAMAGGTPVAPKPKVAPPKRMPPPPPKAEPKAPAVQASTEDACWAKINEVMADKNEGQISNAWFKLVEKINPGMAFADITPEGWGKVMAELEDNIPY